ncbi:MAG: YbaN family protein [Desulfotomaculaceae bacterium]|nr:YbaN family protein [Desulfotomaculaceae bacterium]
MTAKFIRKYLLIITGSLSLALGIIGVFMPVLPTTPFLLLASFCYIRSSSRMYNWLINHKILGSYIYNYVTYRAIKQSIKIGALIFLWFTLAISILVVSNLHIRLLLFVVGFGVSVHLLTLKTLKEENRH